MRSEGKSRTQTVAPPSEIAQNGSDARLTVLKNDSENHDDEQTKHWRDNVVHPHILQRVVIGSWWARISGFRLIDEPIKESSDDSEILNDATVIIRDAESLSDCVEMTTLIFTRVLDIAGYRKNWDIIAKHKKLDPIVDRRRGSLHDLSGFLQQRIFCGFETVSGRFDSGTVWNIDCLESRARLRTELLLKIDYIF